VIKIEINVDPKEGILDPQGKTVERALKNLSFSDVCQVRIGKHIILDIDMDDEDLALKEAEKMCKELLANPLIEEFSIKLIK